MTNKKTTRIFIQINIALIFFLTSCKLNAQNTIKDRVTSKSAYAEKIYIQLSSTVFATDETIWLKAIVTDAVTHTPTSLSGALHVELIDFDERVIDKKLLKIESGIGTAFFQLNATLKSGRYLIRAYTEWNKNFGEDFISEQYIDIYKPKQIQETQKVIRDITLTEIDENQFKLSAKIFPKTINSKHKGKLLVKLDMGLKKDSLEIKKNSEDYYSLNYTLPKNVVKTKLELKLDSIKPKHNDFTFLSTYEKTIVVNDNYLDLQFFPEGGKLVDNLLSTVAFKATDYKNAGTEVKGFIVDELGNKLLAFKSNTLGMGTFNLLPSIAKKYYGLVEVNEKTYKYPLPEISKTGYVLTLKQIADNIIVKIASNFNKNGTVFLQTTARGMKYHNTYLTLKNNELNLKLDKKTLPEGIIKLTLFDSNKLPILERLFFNYREDDGLTIASKTHLSNYSQRDKTIINLTTKDKFNKSISANTSVLVINKEILASMHQKRQNILSFFLLNSEIKGRIEKPSHYFKSTNKNRARDLDALLLTQGWRNYKYNNNSSLLFKYKPKKSITISGTVGEYFNKNKRPKKPIELTLMTFGKQQDLFLKEVDSTGRFNFDLGDVYTNNLEFLIQSKTSKGENKNFTINIDKKRPPKITFKKEEKEQLTDTVSVYYKKSIERQNAEEEFKISSNTIALDEVTISGYKMTPERKKMMELHGPPDVVIEGEELQKNKKKWTSSLFNLLATSYPHAIRVIRVGGNAGFLYAQANGADFTFVIIDGKPVRLREYRFLETLPIKEIKSIEVLERPKNTRKYVIDVFGDPRRVPGSIALSFINIYTHSKNGLFGIKPTSGITKNRISGFTPTMEFYAPKHEDLTLEEWKEPDLRSVVYWNPNIQTDSNGNAQIEFYNADYTGDMLVIVEAISKDGKIGYYETTYTVEEKLEK